MSADPDLDRLLSTALRSSRTADDCPDAEQLAAFADNTLARREAAAVEQHVSNCARCTAVLATLVDAEPVSTASAVTPWWSMHAWRWLVPAATAVLVAGLWFSLRAPSAVRDDQPIVMASRDLNGSPIDQLKSGPPSEQNKPAPSAAPAETTHATEAKRDDARSRTTALGQTVPQQGEAVKDRPAEFAPVPSGDTVRRQSGQAAAGGTPADSSGRLSETVAAAERAQKAEAANESSLRDAASSRAAAEEPSGAARRAESALSAPATPTPTPPAAAPEPPPPSAAAAAGPNRFGGPLGAPAAGGAGGGRGGGRGGRAAPAFLAQAAGPPIAIGGGSGQAQWRINGMNVERSDDGGATWSSAYQASRVLTGGAIAMDDTIWVVGPSGLVVRGTSSGWAIVSRPVAADLAAVSAVSTRGATVRTRDGRDFRTVDAGVTWQQQ
jgi:hypothetical protein